jgi:RNA polymerase sigma factor (sigma-70 family)
MLAVRAGDIEKLGVLFERYYARLFEFLCRMTGNAAASEDLVQDVFLRMLKYRRSFGEDSEFRAWMYQIARNVRSDFFAKNRTTDMSPEIAELAGSPFTQHDAAEREQHSELLARALMALPEDKREILVLARYQEMKYEEIASLLGIEINAFKVRVHRAMAELRDAYQTVSGKGKRCTAI